MLIILDKDIVLERNADKRPTKIWNKNSGEVYIQIKYSEDTREVISYEDIQGNIYDKEYMDFPFYIEKNIEDMYIPENPYNVGGTLLSNIWFFDFNDLHIILRVTELSLRKNKSFIIYQGNIYEIVNKTSCTGGRYYIDTDSVKPCTHLCTYTYAQGAP